MLSRIFTLNDKTIQQVMVPKDKMTTINDGWPNKKILKTVLKSGYSRFPISNGKGTEIIGSIYAKDILEYVASNRSFSLNRIMRPPFFVDGNKKIDVQLRSFQAKKAHQAIVLNKDGQVIGLITLEDILEELVGSIEDEKDFS